MKTFGDVVKRLALLIAICLSLQIGICSLAQAMPEDSVQVKELNFVFLHGAGGTCCDMQLLDDCIMEQLPTHILDYEHTNPGTTIRVDSLQRCYPDDVDIGTWASNIAADIAKYFPDKKNLILVGHSMGGKAALYAVAHNIGGLSEKVALVVTINSPIRSLNNYYLAAAASILDYYRAVEGLLSDRGAVNSIVNYDSSKDGKWVGFGKYWLAFISGEAAPMSGQFDVGGIDALPRDMDDTIIPISAQYSDGADVIYYGEYSHSDFTRSDKVASFIAEQILRYIFGGPIEFSVLATGGTFEHKAGWLPVKYAWNDVVGEVLVSSGKVQHTNESHLKWQEWEDVVGESLPEGKRSSYQVNRENFFPFLTSIQESRWFSADNPADCRLYLRTRAAPGKSIQVEWSIHRQLLLPAGVKRDRYEVEIVTGTPLTDIAHVSWVTDDPRDLTLRIWSEAEGPYRWFKVGWRVYFKETRESKIIGKILG